MNNDLSPVQLSLEKQFEISAFGARLVNLSRQDLEHLCVEVYRNMLMRDAIHQELIKKEWGLDDGASTGV